MAMNPSGDYDGTKRFAQARWPIYGIVYGGGFLLGILVIGLGIVQGWLGLIPLSLAALMILCYFAGTSLWAAHRLYDNSNILKVIFELGRFRADDSFVYLDVGLKWLPASMARRLTTGQITVIDLYNPHLTPDGSLARAYRLALHPKPDPRLSWLDGNISLLPLPDDSVSTVVLAEVASEFWQEGDRKRLISEIYRILAPGGRLILGERVRTTPNLLMMGWAGLSMETADYWKTMLTERGFRISGEKSLEDLMHFIRAEKPLLYEGRQLIFDFG
jgi:SAM-dependent methyltransferase